MTIKSIFRIVSLLASHPYPTHDAVDSEVMRAVSTVMMNWIMVFHFFIFFIGLFVYYPDYPSSSSVNSL